MNNKIKIGILLSLISISGTSVGQTVEYNKVSNLDGKKVKSNAVITIDLDKNNRVLSINGSSNPDSMNATCNIEGFSNILGKKGVIDKYLLTTEKTYQESNNCAVLVEIGQDDNHKPIAIVQMNEGYGCQVFCGIEGNVHYLEGIYR